jgi:predicted ATP-dependent endonuclease of OLD family
MKLTKFERRKQEILKKHEEELRALEAAERKEREKMIEPVVDKVSKVASEEARKILEKNPEILETYSFKKRDAAKVISAALEALFNEVDEEQKSVRPGKDIHEPAHSETFSGSQPSQGGMNDI